MRLFRKNLLLEDPEAKEFVKNMVFLLEVLNGSDFVHWYEEIEDTEVVFESEEDDFGLCCGYVIHKDWTEEFEPVRVIALSHTNTDTMTAYVYGYGYNVGSVYNEVLGFNNPKIKLDSGKIIWGYECYWGSADKLQKELDLFNIVWLE